MRDRVGEVLSRILSEKHDAKIKVEFKEREDDHKERNNRRTGRAGSDAGKRNQKAKKENSST